MGRPPIGKTAMTAAERQKRRRRKITKAATAEILERKRCRARDEAASKYMPIPPGITYWDEREHVGSDGQTFRSWVPQTRPVAACAYGLTKGDVLAVLKDVTKLAVTGGYAAEAVAVFRGELQEPPLG